MNNFILESFTQAEETIHNFLSDEKNIESVASAIELLTTAFQNRNHVYSCGNGGSMCDAMHFAEELTGRFRDNRPALPAAAISDPGHISCVGNDYGYDQIFAKHLEAFAKEGDVLVAISTSGNSKNVIEAVKVAQKKNMKVIGLLGKDGGQLISMVDNPIVVKSNYQYADRIQEVHIKIIHTMIEGVERSLFPDNY